MTLAVHGPAGIPATKAANLRVRTGAGIKGAANSYLRTAAGLHRFFSKFAVAISSTGTSAGFNSSGAATLTTRPVTASVTGAVGTVTYVWSQVSGDTMTITNPSGSETAFQASVSPGDTLEGIFKCTISDSSGHSADTPEVTATIANRYGGIA